MTTPRKVGTKFGKDPRVSWAVTAAKQKFAPGPLDTTVDIHCLDSIVKAEDQRRKYIA